MRKLKLLFLLCVSTVGGALSVSAQTDVTSTYLKNAGFESGTAATSDVTTYIAPASWTLVNGENGASSTAAYGSSKKVNKVTPPSSAASEFGKNCYVIQGAWSANNYIYQTCTLPAGNYKLIYNARRLNSAQNVNANNTGVYRKSTSSYVVKGEANDLKNASTSSFTERTLAFSFTEETEVEIRVGYKAENVGSNATTTAALAFDNIKLIYTDFKAELRAVIAQAQAINARISTLSDNITTAQGVLDDASASKSTIEDAVTTLRSAISTKLAAYTGLNAAGDDITSFIANNGFETSPTFDGTSLGSGSDPKSNATPTDGSTLLLNAKNVYQINGWELLTTETSDFARTFTMPYNTTLYVVSNNAVAGQAVASPTNESSVTTSNDDLLFVEANWCENAVLGVKQTLPLPAGSYRLTFDSYVTNAIGNAESRCGVSYGESTDYKWPAALNTWTANEVDFTLDEQKNVTISMGYKKIGNVGGGSSAFLFVDNVKLTYFDPLKLAQIQWKETWDALDALDETALPDAAETAITNALAETEPTTVEGYNTAKANLQALIDSYNGIKAAYAKVLALIEFATAEKDNSTGDKTTFTTAISSATTDIETCTTAAALEEDYNTLETARQAYVTGGAQPTADHVFDLTFKINDATVTDKSKWDNVGTASGQQYTGAPDNTYMDCGWNTSTHGRQTVSSLPAGYYTLKAATRAKDSEVTSANIYVNQDRSALNQSTDNHRDGNTGGELGNGWGWTEVDFELRATGNVTVGFYAQTTGQGWAGADDFHLYYKGNAVDDETANALKATVVSGKMNATVASEQSSALSAFESTQTIENYEALEKAIAAASASKSAYEGASAKLTAMKTVVDATNVYTEAALNDYYTTPKSKYDDNSLTTDEANALQDPTASTGARAAITVDNFLLSAWNTEPDFTAEDSPYYINSWSTEGNTDGSGMTTPFFEYWVANSSTAKLGERTLTATLSDIPEGNYHVDVLVRVSKNTGDNPTPHGITLDVNGGTSVDVCAGNQIGSTTYYYDTFRALGTVADDGILTINLNVAEDNNISWLAFKNVTYAPFSGATEEQKAALASAITTAEGKTLGFAKDEYAPYNNIDALEKLAIAKAIDTETATALEVTTATSNLSGATWTANDDDVDAIYNGMFATVAEGQNYPKGWTRTNAWGQMKSGLEGDYATAYYNQPGSLKYGNTGVYTMPLAENTIYKLTVAFRSHAENSNNALTISVLNESKEGLSATNVGWNKSATEWKLVSRRFKTGSAGNYIVTLSNDGNTWMTNVSLVKDENCISEEDTWVPLAKASVDITLTRTLSKDYWNTFSVPFDAAIPDGWTVKKFVYESSDVIYFGDAESIEAGKPYLVKPNETVENPTFNNVIVKSIDGSIDGTGDYQFAAQIYNKELPTNGTIAYLSTDHMLKRLTSGGIKGLRAYFIIPAGAEARISFGDDDTTGISSVDNSKLTKDDTIYDLQGRKVTATKKGIYVVNGKKVIK